MNRKTNLSQIDRVPKASVRRQRANWGTPILGIAWSCLIIPAALGHPADGKLDGNDRQILTIDHFVTHVSTVAANKGKVVGLFVRERVEVGKRRGAPAVLMLHGTPISSTPAFDVPFRDYSWMAFLAKAGFDVYAMDVIV